MALESDTPASIIIINGHPGTGKTSIGRTLSDELRIPLISKDEIKDRIFDTLGYRDKAWSLRVSAAAHRIMDYAIGEQLSAGQSVIVESNFKPEIDSERFNAFKAKYQCTLGQLLLVADGTVIYRRFMDKMNGPERHPGHVEELGEEAIRQGFLVPYEPLQIEGQTIEVDTTDFGNVDMGHIAAEMRNMLDPTDV